MTGSEIITSLVKRIAKGDENAFEKFYNLYYPKIFKFSRYFVKTEELCQEIVMDLFYNMWQSRKKLDGIQNIDGYLYTSVKNLSFKTIKNTNKLQHASLDEFSGEFFIETESPEQIYVDHELKTIIETAINELPERCKLIFIMVREQGLKHKEIAEILSISEHTVHAQITIATKKISSALKEYYL
jgi:RNA polymerase sigma-70 factor (family 1)